METCQVRAGLCGREVVVRGMELEGDQQHGSWKVKLEDFYPALPPFPPFFSLKLTGLISYSPHGRFHGYYFHFLNSFGRYNYPHLLAKETEAQEGSLTGAGAAWAHVMCLHSHHTA